MPIDCLRAATGIGKNPLLCIILTQMYAHRPPQPLLLQVFRPSHLVFPRGAILALTQRIDLAAALLSLSAAQSECCRSHEESICCPVLMLPNLV